MDIRFNIGSGPKRETVNWGLKAVPRIGERVVLDRFRSGRVFGVNWVLADENGNILKAPYVLIELK